MKSPTAKKQTRCGGKKGSPGENKQGNDKKYRLPPAKEVPVLAILSPR